MAAAQYLTFSNPKTRNRITHLVWQAVVAEFGHGDRLYWEEEWARVSTALTHLFHNDHYDGDAKIAGMVRSLRDNHDELLAHPEVDTVLSERRQKRLQVLMDRIVTAHKTDQSRWHVSANDLERYIRIANIARRVYSTSGYGGMGYNPDAFVDLKYVEFAAVVSGKYDVYAATMNWDYFELPVATSA